MRALQPPREAGIDGVAAWERSLAEPYALWDAGIGTDKFAGSVMGRLAEGYATPHIEPKFALRDDDVFFCMGSCFAREIERQLGYRGYTVTSAGVRLEYAEEAQEAPNGIVNKFTTASMLNEARWSLAGDPFPDEALVLDRGGYRDLQLGNSPLPVPIERARGRRAEMLEYFGRLRDASVVVITLGIVEVWYDRLANLYLNLAPGWEAVHRYPGRFTVHRTDYAENRERLEAVLDLLTSRGRSDLRVVVTVSPVAMHRTFAGVDVLAENGYGKSTLRAVAGDVVRDRANVEYFPAYELVTVTDRNRAHAPDQRHVTKDMADQVARTFLNAFGIGRDDARGEFDEVEYLKANPDVRIAVADSVFQSGYEHWTLHGRAERRPLRR